jgi:hypothetical protein
VDTLKSGFSPVVHRDSRLPGAWKSMSLADFLLVQTFFNQILFEFLKEIVLIKFWWNNEKLKFCSKNPAIFQKKKSRKSGRSSGFFDFFYNLG